MRVAGDHARPSGPGDGRRRRAGFWRRLSAAWVDSFVIYAIASFLVMAAAAMRARIGIEPLFVIVAAVYGAALLARFGQTAGKMLLGIALTTRAGAPAGLRRVLLREVVGKWGMTFVAPVALGRVLVGQAWVPTASGALVLLPVLLLLVLYVLIARRTWYDQLAGTAVERVPAVPARSRRAFAALMAAAVLGVGTKAGEFAARGWIPCRLTLYHGTRQTAPYVAFLEQHGEAPVDYVIGLFDQHDVVVLCERLHPEGSQWEFILEVVRNPEFIDRVGHVFTEYGQVGMQAHLDAFMDAGGLPASEVHARAVHLMRHGAVWPVWINTNFYLFLTRLYELNQSLPPGRRVDLHFTDAEVDWPELTAEGYAAYRRSLHDRDEQMARRVIEEMDRLAKSAGTPPKCLVVMNYRHAFDLTGGLPEAQRFNTYEYLHDAYGDRAANVLLNMRLPLFPPVAGGVWDAAFAETGNRAAGFDLEGSPFGEDPFDLFPFRPEVKGRLRYRDVFTGFVFAHPWEEQYIQHGIPAYFEGFEAEAVRRAGLVGEEYVRIVQTLIEDEKTGQVGARKQLPGRSVESYLELFLLGATGAGLVIGATAFMLVAPPPSSTARPRRA